MQDSVPGPWDRTSLLAVAGGGAPSRAYETGRAVFKQGAPADAVFYLQRGKVKLSTLSPRGREAVIGMFGAEDFFGEGCLTGQTVRTATATALTPCSVVRLEKDAMTRALRARSGLSETFIAHLINRNIRMEEDLTDQLFNFSEKRLARLLLRLASAGDGERPQPVIEKMSQQTLADMIGTTRSRVSFFMNKFRRQGLIEYRGGANVSINSSLLSVLLHE